MHPRSRHHHPLDPDLARQGVGGRSRKPSGTASPPGAVDAAAPAPETRGSASSYGPALSSPKPPDWPGDGRPLRRHNKIDLGFPLHSREWVGKIVVADPNQFSRDHNISVNKKKCHKSLQSDLKITEYETQVILPRS
ncbi:hypothetical protein PIB30_089704 [Stylosanthes scabra]|uniref:Uncharacterized protein n=1 Tax=Stylosanthes scabra TaxID=79078 RepID=A0ABU6TTP5_9FABA|nr:hypothetical protein [Stylosanthes scabra]